MSSDDERPVKPMMGRGRGRGRGAAPPTDTLDFMPARPSSTRAEAASSLGDRSTRLGSDVSMCSVASDMTIGDVTESADFDSTTGTVRALGSDRMALQSAQSSASSSQRTSPLPEIRKFAKTYNEKGRAIPLMANFFRMTFAQQTIYDYHVEFEPICEISAAKRRILYSFMQTRDKNVAFAYDNYSNMKCLLDLGDRNCFTGKLQENNSEVTVTITRTGTVGWDSPEMVRTMNMMMKRNFRLINLSMLGRHYFDMSQKSAVPGFNLELIPGFATTVSPCASGLLMVCDNVTKVSRTESVLQLLTEIRNKARINLAEEAKRELCGSIVLTTYNHRTYRVDDIDFDKNCEMKFMHKAKGADPKMIDLAEYYKDRYNVAIRQPKQPLLVVMPSKAQIRGGRGDEPIYLVPELCRLTGLTDSQRANFNLMKSVASAARLGPADRIAKLQQFSRRLAGEEQVRQNMIGWSVTFEKDLVPVKGMILEDEKIFTGPDPNPQSEGYEQFTGDFTKVIRGKRMRLPVEFTKVAVLYPGNQERQVREFISTLERVLKPMGCIMRPVKPVQLPDDRASTYLATLNQFTGRNGGTPAELLLIILPTNAKDRYDAVKKFLCCDVGIPSQVVVAKTINNPKGLMSIATKVGIQMAVKLGGRPWSLNIPARGIMVVGFDSYHDSSRKGKSVGGFVASQNHDLTAWFSKCAFHERMEEMSDSLAGHMDEALRSYRTENGGHLPSRIIIYRDGVSDGQIPHVLKHEVERVNQVLENTIVGGPTMRPHVTFMIVTKRISARFYAKRGNQIENPPPGTAIDREVTRADSFDFYLISQSVRQGTVAPTHYNIIHESEQAVAGSLKIGNHQRLAYKLTHLYYNWNGTIRVPAPVQYAHKLAYLVGTHLHKEPAEQLSNKLFFL